VRKKQALAQIQAMKKQLLANHKGNCTGRGRLTTSPFYSDLVGQAEYLSKEFIGEPTRRVGANQNEEPTPSEKTESALARSGFRAVACWLFGFLVYSARYSMNPP
jgi:hypothetical protein